MNLTNKLEPGPEVSRRGFLCRALAVSGAYLVSKVDLTYAAEEKPEEYPDITDNMIVERLKQRGKYEPKKERELREYLKKYTSNKDPRVNKSVRIILYESLDKNPQPFLEKNLTKAELEDYKTYKPSEETKKVIRQYPWKINPDKPDESDRAYAYLTTVVMPKRLGKSLDEAFGSAGFPMVTPIIGPKKKRK